jgi:two-component system, cell cycle sensor histidine kinase and response regulator CckA
MVVSKIPLPPAAKLNDASFRILVEHSNDAIVMFDSDWKITYVSPRTERILGFQPEESVGREALSFVHPDDIPGVKVLFDEILANPGKPISSTARVRHKDGSWRILEGVCTNLLHDPQVRGIVTNYRDSTKRIEAERALRESEEKFKRTFQSNPNSMTINTLEEGIFLDVNDAFLRISGFSREDIIGRRSTDTSWVDKEDRSRMLRLLHEQGCVEGMETAFHTKSGKVLFSSLSAVIVEIGGQKCVLTTSQDITERRRAADKLRQSEEKYRSLVELAPYGIFRATRDGRLLMVNSALVKLLGYDTAEEVLRLDLQTQIYADPTERERILKLVTSSAPGLRVETTWTRKDGSTISVRLAARLILGNRNELLQTEVFVENVTEQKELERQLLMAQKMDAVGQLAGGLAHDFNNLLAVINSRAMLVMDDPSERTHVVAQADEIARATRRAATLTRQLLALSRKQVLEPVVLNLNALLTELGDMLPHLVGKKIETRIVTAPGLGRVKVDRGQFEQVVMNLVINARDAMPHGGCLVIETANVTLDANQPERQLLMKAGRYVVLSVSDNGVGMNLETQERIFEPFFTTKERGKGTGLGLAMVYGIVQQSGGHLSVNSSPGTGTSFKIFLPEVTELEETAGTEQLLPVPGGSETILFVEDDEALREVCANFLRSKGYDVVTAEDGIEALGICRTLDRRVHLLVTDLIMPRMGGVELAKNALALSPGLRTIYLSGYKDQALPHGTDAVQPLLQKPFSMADLAKQVRASLDRGSPAEPERKLAS